MMGSLPRKLYDVPEYNSPSAVAGGMRERDRPIVRIHTQHEDALLQNRIKHPQGQGEEGEPSPAPSPLQCLPLFSHVLISCSTDNCIFRAKRQPQKHRQ